MTKIWKFIRHNIGFCVGVPISFLFLFYCYSCESKVISLVNSNVKINRAELIIEVDQLLARAAARFDDLDQQDLVKDTIFNSVLDLAQGKNINPLGVVLTLAGILGLGAGVDNIKKRTHINTLKGERQDG